MLPARAMAAPGTVTLGATPTTIDAGQDVVVSGAIAPPPSGETVIVKNTQGDGNPGNDVLNVPSESRTFDLQPQVYASILVRMLVAIILIYVMLPGVKKSFGTS